MCRYIARPAVSTQRLSLTRHGKVRYELKTPYSDGTTQVIFDPLDFIARLAALVSKPRLNLTRFHCVYAPNSKYRMQVPDIHQWRLWVGSGYSPLSVLKFRFWAQSGYSNRLIFVISMAAFVQKRSCKFRAKVIYGASINGSYVAILLAFCALALHVPKCCHQRF